MEKIKTIIDREKNIIVCTVIGKPNADEYIMAIKDYRDKDPQKYIVWDYTEADLSGLSSQDLENIMYFSLNHPNTHITEKIALILPSDLSYGMGRMFEVFGEQGEAPWDLQPFRRAEDAFQWIGIKDIRKK